VTQWSLPIPGAKPLQLRVNIQLMAERRASASSDGNLGVFFFSSGGVNDLNFAGFLLLL
jgi:hypothetical protein